LDAGKRHSLIGIGRSLVGPDIPVAIRGVLGAACGLEPGVLVGSVIDKEVDNDADAALLAAVGELDKIAERAVARIDAIVIGDVVAVILARRRMKRHQPDRADAKTVQIVKPAQQSLEIADAVAISIHIGADGKTIEDAVLVPEIVDHQTSLPADLRAAISKGAALSSTGQWQLASLRLCR